MERDRVSSPQGRPESLAESPPARSTPPRSTTSERAAERAKAALAADGVLPLRHRMRWQAIRTPVLGNVGVFAYRAWKAMKIARRQLRQLANVLRWLFTSREFTNITCHITEQNQRELVEFIHVLTGTGRERAVGYLEEAIQDEGLRRHVAELTAESGYRSSADLECRPGKRIGWYALVRILKPKVVVESGIDKGLGCCVIAAALLRNEAEGAPGRLYALDIDPHAGWLIAPPYDRLIDLRVRDSHETLREFDQEIDLFVHDSNHSYEHEAAEYEIIRSKLADHCLVLSDNAHAETALMDFARVMGRPYYFWQERPVGHYSRGGGIGAVPVQRPATTA